jgi:hypothetical protein
MVDRTYNQIKATLDHLQAENLSLQDRNKQQIAKFTVQLAALEMAANDAEHRATTTKSSSATPSSITASTPPGARPS